MLEMPTTTTMHFLLFIVGSALAISWLASVIGGRLRAASRPVDVPETEPEAEAATDWKTECEAERRKRFELVAIISDIQRERDQYKNLWWTCATEHGAAQHFMAEKYAALVKICKRHNVNPREDAQVAKLASEYEARHGEEKRVAIREGIDGARTPEHAAIEAGAIAVTTENV